MDVQASAIVVLAVLVVADLIFTYGAVRRLRDDEARLALGGGVDVGLPPASPSPGQTLDGFTARVMPGTELSSSFGAQVWCAGLFTPTCAPRIEQLPKLLELLDRPGTAPGLIVVVGSADEASTLLRRVGRPPSLDDARLVTGDPAFELSDLWVVDRLPTMLAVKAGAVMANGSVVGALPDLSSAGVRGGPHG